MISVMTPLAVSSLGAGWPMLTPLPALRARPTVVDVGIAPDEDAVRRELRAAYKEFAAHAANRWSWGLWTGSGRRILGPYNATQVAGIYRRILGGLFLVGVVLTLMGGLVGQLGAALVVGSLFAFGSWMAQAWVLSREREFKATDEMLSDLERERLEPYADRIRILTHQLRDLKPPMD